MTSEVEQGDQNNSYKDLYAPVQEDVGLSIVTKFAGSLEKRSFQKSSLQNSANRWDPLISSDITHKTFNCRWTCNKCYF